MNLFLCHSSPSETVAVVDGGGRGAALARGYTQSHHVKRVLGFPGNDYIRDNPNGKEVITHPHLKTTSVEDIVKICKQECVKFVDVAQDNAVVAGLVDALRSEGILTVGPTRKAGQIESSKAFTSHFVRRKGIPAPSSEVFTTPEAGTAYIQSKPDQGWVIKADGLAEGKGVVVADNKEEAIAAISEIKKFGDAATRYLVQMRAYGEEFSSFVLSDGKTFQPLGDAQDHKRVGTFDVGPNTGGMGCSTPPLVLTDQLKQCISQNIIERTLAGMRLEGNPYEGVLYLGGMVQQNGAPTVIEYNSRWGDPEAQVLVPGITEKNDLFEVMLATAEKRLHEMTLELSNKARVVVTGASRGYPGNYSDVKGREIFGIDEARKIKGVTIDGAGMRVENGRHFANGGRLFYVIGEGQDVIEARAYAYAAMSRIFMEGNTLLYRNDIGWRDVERLRKRQPAT